MMNMNLNLILLSSSPIIYSLFIMFFLNSINNMMWKIQSYMFIMLIMFLIYLYMFKINFNFLLMENKFMGLFSFKKKKFLYNGFLLFILSEMMIFISLFWSYIHNIYVSNMYMGNFWPPKGIIIANPTGMIIFGTSILISSSFLIMMSHYLMLIKNFKIKSMIYFYFCLIMGILFIDMQILEMSNFFMQLEFNFNDSVFSSSFLSTTSLHASHVFLGLMSLYYSFKYIELNLNSIYMYMNFEFSIWYWHFVDYIWIFVFSMFYYFNKYF